MITSTDNKHIKEVRKLARRAARERSGRFVAEGEDLVQAAEAAGWPAVYRLCPVGQGSDGWIEVREHVLNGVSALGSGSRAIAVYEQRWSPPVGPLCVYLHGVADPGNVGTVLRSALAFGAACVALGPGCADPYGPRAVRASMGAVFAVPLARVDDVAALPGERVALVARAGEPLRGPAAGPVTLLVGAERAGLPDEVVAACERVAQIPITSESLNAAMAATVALYELSRPSRVPSP